MLLLHGQSLLRRKYATSAHRMLLRSAHELVARADRLCHLWMHCHHLLFLLLLLLLLLLRAELR